MKKFLIAALALAVGASMATAGMRINWSNGGWLVAYGENPDLSDLGAGVVQADSAIWQLIYAGKDNIANDIDLKAANYLSGDDELLASRDIPVGGGAASDGTSWTVWLEYDDGDSILEDLSWDKEVKTGEYVYQRIFQGTPAAGSYYLETELFKFNPEFKAGDGLPADSFYYDPDCNGLAVNKQIPGQPEPPGPQVPEPATMSLLGLGALAMVLRRKIRK